MSESIKTIFDDECKSLKIDARFVRAIHLYQVAFVNKNREHIEFFGGHLLGVQTVKFMPSDRDRWFSEILKVEEGPLTNRLLQLEAVDPEHKVIGSDTMNLSAVWITHALMSAKGLSDKQKHEAAVDVMMVLQYKFLTSLLSHYFKYPADRSVAEATYASLSGRYLIKQYDNWLALFRGRGEDIMSDDGIHADTIEKMKNDDDIIDMLNDIQGRIRDMLKNIYGEFMLVHANSGGIVSTSSVVEHDGAEILRDKTKNLSAYSRYIKGVVTDKNSFIREELVNIICKLMDTMPPRLFRETLTYMSDNYQQRHSSDIEEVLDKALVHSFAYISDHRELVSKNTDLAELLSRLRGVYTSSRSTDPELFTLRETTQNLVKRATGNKNESVIASVRTGILLYVILRSYTMRYFTTHA
jgi:hypothetical protein